jgi:hypothetical protein
MHFGACSNGSTALPRGATGRTSGGATTTKTARAQPRALKADLKALKDDRQWPAAYTAWLVFERFTGASVKVQVAPSVVNDAVNLACRTGQPNDIAMATGLVIRIYGVVKEAYLKAQADAQAAKAAQPAPAPTQ